VKEEKKKKEKGGGEGAGEKERSFIDTATNTSSTPPMSALFAALFLLHSLTARMCGYRPRTRTTSSMGERSRDSDKKTRKEGGGKCANNARQKQNRIDRRPRHCRVNLPRLARFARISAATLTNRRTQEGRKEERTRKKGARPSHVSVTITSYRSQSHGPVRLCHVGRPHQEGEKKKEKREKGKTGPCPRDGSLVYCRLETTNLLTAIDTLQKGDQKGEGVPGRGEGKKGRKEGASDRWDAPASGPLYDFACGRKTRPASILLPS